jgi:hypothetical protein
MQNEDDEDTKNNEAKVDSLLNIYLKEEGIDKSYSNLILQELYDATELTNDQINSAANEILNATSTENLSENQIFQQTSEQDNDKSNKYF